MPITLTKGGNVSLTKEAPGMTKLNIGLGWDVRATSGDGFDLDATVFLLKSDGKVRSDADMIFYNNLKTPDGSVEHTGDNKTGAGEGDDETIKVDLSSVPADIEKIAVCVSIYEGDKRNQNFGMVSHAFVRVIDQGTNAEVARYDLSEDASTVTSMIFGELYRHNGEWKFKAIGQGFNGGLAELTRNFGVNLG